MYKCPFDLHGSQPCGMMVSELSIVPKGRAGVLPGPIPPLLAFWKLGYESVYSCLGKWFLADFVLLNSRSLTGFVKRQRVTVNIFSPTPRFAAHFVAVLGDLWMGSWVAHFFFLLQKSRAPNCWPFLWWKVAVRACCLAVINAFNLPF